MESLASGLWVEGEVGGVVKVGVICYFFFLFYSFYFHWIYLAFYGFALRKFNFHLNVF